MCRPRRVLRWIIAITIIAATLSVVVCALWSFVVGPSIALKTYAVERLAAAVIIEHMEQTGGSWPDDCRELRGAYNRVRESGRNECVVSFDSFCDHVIIQPLPTAPELSLSELCWDDKPLKRVSVRVGALLSSSERVNQRVAGYLTARTFFAGYLTREKRTTIASSSALTCYGNSPACQSAARHVLNRSEYKQAFISIALDKPLAPSKEFLQGIAAGPVEVAPSDRILNANVRRARRVDILLSRLLAEPTVCILCMGLVSSDQDEGARVCVRCYHRPNDSVAGKRLMNTVCIVLAKREKNGCWVPVQVKQKQTTPKNPIDAR